MLADYRHTSISVGVHPLELLRPHLPEHCVPSGELSDVPHGSRIAVAGMAVARQRPSTANGIVFMLLEDEQGQVEPHHPAAGLRGHRAIVRGEPLLLARGRFERVGRNENVLVEAVESLGPLARRVAGEAEVRSALPRPTISGTGSDRLRGTLWCDGALPARARLGRRRARLGDP